MLHNILLKPYLELFLMIFGVILFYVTLVGVKCARDLKLNIYRTDMENLQEETTANQDNGRSLHPVLAPVISKPVHAKPSLYSFYFELIKEIGLKYGYNIVLHGSMNRDLDLIAIPWQDLLGNVDLMVDEIANTIGGVIMVENKSRFTIKPHGRVVYIININRDFEMKYSGMKAEIKKYSDPQYYIDISVTPVSS